MTPPAAGLAPDEHGQLRCLWRFSAPEYAHYHDHEWGVAVRDDVRLFEKICLEGFQAGMAWITILRKREQFREAFDGFDFTRIAHYDAADIERLLVNPGIVRNRAKIVSVINNARRCLELIKDHGTLAQFIWSFEPPVNERPVHVDLDFWTRNTTSEASIRLSNALKKRGWTFVGPTTMHALMQAVGLVNDHLSGCVCRAPLERVRLTSGI